MRWQSPKVGDRRTRSFFAWNPFTVYHINFSETRWMERVTVKERFRQGRLRNFWVVEGFVDDSK